MSFLTGMEISASGLSAQRSRLNIISSNMANAQTTSTENGGPYRRQSPVFETTNVSSFDGVIDEAIRGVRVDRVQVDETTPTQFVYDPGHRDANAEGFVEMPNVNIVEEMVDMLTASRSYEANATSFETLKNMAMRAMSIGG